MPWIRMGLATRLGITHGAFVVLLGVLLVVTLQGLLRMLGVITVISDQRLSTLSAEEDLHRAAWGIEVALRHARTACADGATDVAAITRVDHARDVFNEQLALDRVSSPTPVREVALKYQALADDVLADRRCEYLARATTEERRMKLDEDMTNAWIESLHDLHADIQAKEAIARAIGTRTAIGGLIVAALGVVAAVFVARMTARSVTQPIARLARDATRLGDGNFTPIEPVGGPPEIDDLRSDLERTREKLLGVDRLKQAFLAGVSHELRSPLGRLREALALLRDGTVGELTTDQKRVVTLASRACEQEVRIVEALLDISRVSSGLPVQPEGACDIGHVVEAAVEAERPVASERGIAIEIERDGVPPSLRLDSALIERAVANLVRNAVSVSPKDGKVFVRIALQTREGRRSVRIDVVDQGPGLGEGAIDRLFQPFSAAKVGARPAGVGLGLSLSREIARAHGGDLILASGTESTTFRMEIPVERESAR